MSEYMIHAETPGRVMHLFIDHPAKRNAMTQAMWEVLPEIIERADCDGGIHVILLVSATPGMFCAGADITQLLANKDNADWLAANQAAINRAQHVLARAFKPVVAFIDGDCIGGGCGLAMAADIRVATPRARFAITPAKLGLVYPLHDTKLLVDLVGPGQAKRLLFSGEVIDAQEALRIGLIEMIADTPDAVVSAISDASPWSAAAAKNFVRRVLDGQTADDAETLEIFAQSFTGSDFLEGSAAFVEKRKPKFGI
jgi:enoyl-CoA hydratase/carnithine racemase